MSKLIDKKKIVMHEWTRDVTSRQRDWNRLPLDLFNTWWELYSHNITDDAGKILKDIDCFLEYPIEESRRILFREIAKEPGNEEWCQGVLEDLKAYEYIPPFNKKGSNITYTHQRTDSNEVKPDPKVIAKNKKNFFINCFGCKIYYE